MHLKKKDSLISKMEIQFYVFFFFTISNWTIIIYVVNFLPSENVRARILTRYVLAETTNTLPTELYRTNLDLSVQDFLL